MPLIQRVSAHMSCRNFGCRSSDLLGNCGACYDRERYLAARFFVNDEIPQHHNRRNLILFFALAFVVNTQAMGLFLVFCTFIFLLINSLLRNELIFSSG